MQSWIRIILVIGVATCVAWAGVAAAQGAMLRLDDAAVEQRSDIDGSCLLVVRETTVSRHVWKPSSATSHERQPVSGVGGVTPAGREATFVAGTSLFALHCLLLN